MVRLLLSIKADMENVTALEPPDDFDYYFEVQCKHCNEIHDKLVKLNRHDEFELPGSKGNTANFVWTCKCRHASSAKFVKEYPIHPYTAEDAQFDFGPLLQIECRGLEFTGFEPGHGKVSVETSFDLSRIQPIEKGLWKCKGMKGTVFPEVDMEEDEWTDYDEKAALPVGVSNFESMWSRAKA